ncbi:MAG TPA: hypothetical protein VFD82_21705 [Planctomycetota bacterium]|nr:hypothetical protein [Planctomycetota bacterium]
MAMIPHERSLVQKWKDKPFALIGVNSDGTDTEEGLAKFREKVKEASMTWRSFRNESTDPTISETWRVQGWPMLYYIDHEGVIRHKDVTKEDEMEKALGEMIAAAEKAAAAPKTAPKK